jgi:ribosomal protein S18 acetylase RimI-like enzyme
MSAAMEIVIRPAQVVDLLAIRIIAALTWQATYPDLAEHNRRGFLRGAYSDESLKTVIASARHWFYVALDQDEVVGFAHFLRRTRHEAELARLYVLPSYQRQGIGTQLLQHGLAALEKSGFRTCYVAVYVNNAGARAFYERHDFVHHRDLGQQLGDQLLHLVQYRLTLAR